ncbi:hypothetical protein KM043_014468 [Ampulex compressa]|nr:hypothetical protein KM043_014468 [Ampulex compressa]
MHGQVPLCRMLDTGPDVVLFCVYARVMHGILNVEVCPDPTLDAERITLLLRLVFLVGDFNAWNTALTSRNQDPKHEILERWAATLALVLLNQGNVPTCVQVQRSSVIDLTLVIPSIKRLNHGRLLNPIPAKWFTAGWIRLSSCVGRPSTSGKSSPGVKTTRQLGSGLEGSGGGGGELRAAKMGLRSAIKKAAPLTERLDPSFLRKVVQTLFPKIHVEERPTAQSGVPHPDWDDGLEIQQEEFVRAVTRDLRNNTAPSPDDLHKWANVPVSAILRSIYDRGLEMASHKTEVIFFHNRRNVSPSVNQSLMVNTAHVKVKSEMRYLGLIFNDRWRFRSHFELATRRTMRK